MESQQNHQRVRPFMDKQTFDRVSAVMWGQNALDYYTNYIVPRARWSDSDIREEALYFAGMARGLRVGASQTSRLHKTPYDTYQGQRSTFHDRKHSRPTYQQGYPGCGRLDDSRDTSPAVGQFGMPMYPGWLSHAYRPMDVSLGETILQPNNPQSLHDPGKPTYPEVVPHAHNNGHPSVDFIPGFPPPFPTAQENVYRPIHPQFDPWDVYVPTYQHDPYGNGSGYFHTGNVEYGGRERHNPQANVGLPVQDPLASDMATRSARAHQIANLVAARDNGHGIPEPSEVHSAPDGINFFAPLTDGQAAQLLAEMPLNPKPQPLTAAHKESTFHITTVENQPKYCSDEDFLKFYKPSAGKRSSNEGGSDNSMDNWFEEQGVRQM
ncbi:MAG: hypothetical protein ALECFALPRED_001843 [Alectoria fallacina]|uniref:Uncharacterized protein n=1 Tax=Alectoria fallacina TaxID=1903189 RepID=A0A8H3IB57_9LECA|nr:MAG: hypothetical protein ALECFALPRED_001843 [Alectoria fallacina]